MLDNEKELKEWKKMLDDNGFHISALSCHGNPLHPDPKVAKGYQDTSKKTDSAGREAWRPGGNRLLRMPR